METQTTEEQNAGNEASSEAPKETPEAPQWPACKCGNTRDAVGKDPWVEAQGEWGAWGWFYLLIGITAVPKIVRFHCRRCSITFDQTTDPAILKLHI